jgi:hypothetical protein
MLLRGNDRLDELLVQILGQHGALEVRDLHAACAKIGREVSIQGIYHELRKLQGLGIVLKVGKTFQLSISWASEFVLFADRVYENCINKASARAILPLEGEKRSWEFTNLLRMDDFWVQIMQTFFVETGNRELFGWIPHPWYYFAQPRKVVDFYRFVKREKRRLYYILGEDTLLARRYVETLSTQIFSHSFAPSPFTFGKHVYLDVTRPYIVKVSVDLATAGRIEKLFLSVKNASDLPFVAVDRALNQPARLRIQIIHDDAAAGRMERKFRDFFGLPRGL